MSPWTLVVTSAVLALTSPVAAADADPALAEQLYKMGRALMAEGHTSEACARFAESQKIDPATGTLLNLATCHEAEGKFATAWSEFKQAELAARRDGRSDREQFAREHVTSIEARLSYITVAVAPESRAPDLEVKVDGVAFEAAAWDVAAPINPGEHEVTATAAGRVPFSAHVTVTYTARRDVVVVVMAPVPSPLRAAPPSVPQSEAEPAAGTAPSRVGAAVAAAVSVVALGAGAAFALRAKRKWDARNATGVCDPDDSCSARGVADGDAANTAATIADVSFVVGAVAAGTAGYLLFAKKPTPSASAAWLRVAPTLNGLALSGQW